MKRKSVGVLFLSCLSAVCLTLGAVWTKEEMKTAEAEGVTMQSEGDSFALGSVSYGEDESFVYTATLHFTADGQAAGLAFGAKENEYYWVFNVDRKENQVKLLYFAADESGYSATELLRDWYIGNDKMTDSEKRLVGNKVATIDSVQLKVVVSAEQDGVHAEFYADNIRRFGVDNDVRLNESEKLPDGVGYLGGALGYNVFNAEVRFDKEYIGKSDYSYYTETYRQQYHFSQYAHWNNDPNGLVYYDGWYHLYYQCHPFSNYWSDMYWGHARSKDLAHWELLPICLFPDADWREGDGFMWSGSAMVYHPGDSDAIDALNWFPNGNGEGLIAFYTRDGGLQDQMIMSSDDGGMTWTKRKLIPQTLATEPTLKIGEKKTDCRDPKVFPVKKNGEKVTLWGMALTGQATNSVWFLKSENLLDWSYAGGFQASRPECPDVATIVADDGTTHTVMSFSGRRYLVGEIRYDEASGRINFFDLQGRNVSEIEMNEIAFSTMDYGPDSYATQTYYIDDEKSVYYGKTVSLSWFSGVPGAAASIDSGALAQLRGTWNGGGMTIPVIWGLKKSGEDTYELTQTPIVKDSDAFAKTPLYSATGVAVKAGGENVLKDVSGKRLEIAASVINPNNADVSFRLWIGGNEYTEIGWTAAEGYYVDRTHTSDGGLAMNAYRARYTSGARSAGKQTFYILADDGGLEVFCDDFSVPFYTLTFAFPASTGMRFACGGDVTIESLTVNEIGSVWRDATTEYEGTVLYLSAEKLELDTSLATEKQVSAYSAHGGEIAWEIESGESVISLTETAQGVLVKALADGEAVIRATCKGVEKRIPVTVTSGTFDCDLTFSSKGILSGDWLMSGDGLTGRQPSGDAFILANESGSNFIYTAKFDLGSGAAAALVFRATEDMSDYYIANYDNNGKIVKLWSPRGELAQAKTGDVDVSALILSVCTEGNRIRVSLNGRQLVDVTDTNENAPTEGRFGLNVCATSAKFSAVSLRVTEYAYDGGALAVKGDVEQYISALYNRTLGNVKIDAAFYTVSGRTLTIAEAYFATLSEIKKYTFSVEGEAPFSFEVNVLSLPAAVLQPLTIDRGCNAVIFVGGAAVQSVEVNGKTLAEGQYTLRNGMVTIYAEALSEGENRVKLSETLSVCVTVNSAAASEKDPSGGENEKKGCKSSVPTLVPTAICAIAIAWIMKKRRKNGNDDQRRS